MQGGRGHTLHRARRAVAWPTRLFSAAPRRDYAGARDRRRSPTIGPAEQTGCSPISAKAAAGVLLRACVKGRLGAKPLHSEWLSFLEAGDYGNSNANAGNANGSTQTSTAAATSDHAARALYAHPAVDVFVFRPRFRPLAGLGRGRINFLEAAVVEGVQHPRRHRRLLDAAADDARRLQPPQLDRQPSSGAHRLDGDGGPRLSAWPASPPNRCRACCRRAEGCDRRRAAPRPRPPDRPAPPTPLAVRAPSLSAGEAGKGARRLTPRAPA